MSELLPCPSTIPPAQPSKVVAALRKWYEIYSEDVIRMNDTAARDPEKVAMVVDLRADTRAALAELGEGRDARYFEGGQDLSNDPIHVAAVDLQIALLAASEAAHRLTVIARDSEEALAALAELGEARS